MWKLISPARKVNNFNKKNIKKTLRDILLLFHDMPGFDMKLQEWKVLYRKAWEIEKEYS